MVVAAAASLLSRRRGATAFASLLHTSSNHFGLCSSSSYSLSILLFTEETTDTLPSRYFNNNNLLPASSFSSSSPYNNIVKPRLFHTTTSPSVSHHTTTTLPQQHSEEEEEEEEEEELASHVEEKTKDSTDIFREWGCTDTDIAKIFQRRPSLRNTDIHILHSKLQLLSQLGIKASDLVRMIHCRPRFLNCKINTWLNERLEYLQDVFGSKEVLVKAIVRNPSLLTYDFHNKIKPVVATYESLGLSKQDLIAMLLSRPTLIPRTTLDDDKIYYINRTGVSNGSKMYKHVVSLFAISRLETIREKVMNMEKYGLPEDEIFHLIGRSPLVLTLSVDKIQRHMTFIMGIMRLPASVVLRNPFLLYFNLENVLKPRYQIACKIEDMDLNPQIKGPALLRALRMTDKRFVSAFLSCHPKEVADELVEAYEDAKRVRRLAELSKKNSRDGRFFWNHR